MPFNRDEVSALLVRCHRRCCICHRFCGVKIETDHIVPTEENGTDEIGNAIPVCFECHAEIHSYNDKHPRGRKFLPDELRAHKEQWLRICAESPVALVTAIRDADVGPLQALIDELDFNAVVARNDHDVRDGVFHEHHCKFQDQQFLRAVREGAIAILLDEIRMLILQAYRAMGAANTAIEAKGHHEINSEGWSTGCNAVARLIVDAGPKISKARDEMLRFLSTERS